MSKIIDGKALAKNLKQDIKTAVNEIKSKYNYTPSLAVILVGENPASKVYVNSKAKQTIECGMESFEFKLPVKTREQDVLAKVKELNNNPKVHGILVQLPLPKHIAEEKIINAIAVEKDVDGFQIINSGQLVTGTGNPLIACTPYGCLMILQNKYGKDLSGLNAVIIGRSNIVGKPMAQLLLDANATITIVHSKTKNIEKITKQADIVVVAVGKPKMVKANWIKQGATIIDVGINHIEVDGKSKLVGDVDFADVEPVAGAITPVPGGVGPMTIAVLLHNSIVAFCRQNNKPIPKILDKYNRF